MEAGLGLDKEIAVWVMGLDVFDDPLNYRGVGTIPHATTGKLGDLLHYSTDIAAAWQVVEHMRSKKWSYYIEGYRGYPHDVEFRGPEQEAGYGPDRSAHADTTPHAICLAALQAVGAL